METRLEKIEKIIKLLLELNGFYFENFGDKKSYFTVNVMKNLSKIVWAQIVIF